MISSCRPRKESKPNTRCSTVAARRAPSGTPATRGLSVAAAERLSGTAAETPVSVGSLASLGSKGEDTRQSYGPALTVGCVIPFASGPPESAVFPSSRGTNRLAPQYKTAGRPSGSRGDTRGLVVVFGDDLAAELALDQGHPGELVGHGDRHVLV